MLSFLNITTFASNIKNNRKEQFYVFAFPEIIIFSNAFSSNLAPTSAANVIPTIYPGSSRAKHCLGNGLILWLINKNFAVIE